MSEPGGPEPELANLQEPPGESRPRGFRLRNPDYSPWSLFELLLAFGANLLLSMALGGGAMAVYGVTDPFELPPVVLMGSGVLAWCGVFALLSVVSSSREELRAGLALRATARPWGLAALSLALALAAAGMMATELEGDLLKDWEEYLSRPGVFPVVAVMALTAAPLFEELFFRGVLQGVAGRYLGALPGIGVAAVAFAVAHSGQYPGAWISMGVLILVGVACGALRHVHDSIWPAVALHFLYNTFTLVGAVTVEVLRAATTGT